MTLNELKRRFPNASAAFIQENLDSDDGGVCSKHSKRIERMPLDLNPEREEACWHDADASFEITFTVYSVRPCDYDGYDIKYLQDWLVSAGIISGDDWKTITGRVCSRKAKSKEEEKTVIEIREVTKEF